MRRLVCDQNDISGGVDTKRGIPTTAAEAEPFESGGVMEAGISGEWVKKSTLVLSLSRSRSLPLKYGKA